MGVPIRSDVLRIGRIIDRTQGVVFLLDSMGYAAAAAHRRCSSLTLALTLTRTTSSCRSAIIQPFNHLQIVQVT